MSKYKWCECDAKTDQEFLGWIYERLRERHKENINYQHMIRLEEVIKNTPGIIPDKLTKQLENNPVLAAQREAFRKALADLNHPEATCYTHWALEAFDIAYDLR